MKEITHCPLCNKDIPVLKWMVYRENINRRVIETFNIFSHSGFFKDVIEAAKTDNKETFAKGVKASLMYYYWCKSEWEILLHPWTAHIDESKFKKIDVYSQVMNNWENFIDYLWGVLHERS